MATQEKPAVWIELERPADASQAAKMAEQANNMLQRISPRCAERFAWSERHCRWMYGTTMGMEYLVDRGIWLPLEWTGRPLTAAEKALPSATDAV